MELLDSECEGTVNIGSGHAIAIRQLILFIGREMNGEHLLRLGALPMREGDPYFLAADTRRLFKEIGWQPSRSLEAGILETIQWWRGAVDGIK